MRAVDASKACYTAAAFSTVSTRAALRPLCAPQVLSQAGPPGHSACQVKAGSATPALSDQLAMTLQLLHLVVH